MVNLTIEQLGLSATEVKKLLDEPVKKFLKEETIIALYTRAYNIVGHQIIIDITNQIMVIDCIYAITAWHSFGSYGQSISNHLQLQDIEAYEANLRHYKEIAINSAAYIGVKLELNYEDTKPPLSDPLPIIQYGGSMLDVE